MFALFKTNIFYIIIMLLWLNIKVNALEVCNSDAIILKNITKYRYKNVPIQKCNCTDLNKCVKKCCALGFELSFGECIFNDQPFIVPFYNDKKFIKNLTIPEDLLSIGLIHHCDFYVKFSSAASFYLQEDFRLYVTNPDEYLPPYEYCVDYVKNEFVAAVCISSSSLEYFSRTINYVGMIISMPFLLATFVAYALLPDRNLHMKALMCYVFNLFHAYLFLVTIQLTPEIIGEPWCTIIGYSCIYFFLASFFWMNVICIDIFLGFRGFKGGPGMRSFEYKRFYYYCLYAWGMSFLIVLLTYFCNTQGTVDDWWYPAVSKGQCFVRNGLPQLIFFYGPMGIIILTNIILFSLTAYRIRQVKKDTKMLKHAESKRHSEDDQQKFKLYLKLLLAMGVNWSMEIISWGVNFKEQEIPPYIWYLTDFCNATYGVFIFFIFVFKKNIWKQLKRRYYAFTGRQYLAHSMATTNHTKTTNYSVSTSTNEQRCEENEL